jgi:hypothetical protein
VLLSPGDNDGDNTPPPPPLQRLDKMTIANAIFSSSSSPPAAATDEEDEDEEGDKVEEVAVEANCKSQGQSVRSTVPLLSQSSRNRSWLEGEEGEEEQDRSSLCSKAVMIWFARDAMAAVLTSGDDDDEDFIAVVLATFLVTGLILSALPLLLGMQLRGGGQLRHWM